MYSFLTLNCQKKKKKFSDFIPIYCSKVLAISYVINSLFNFIHEPNKCHIAIQKVKAWGKALKLSKAEA